MRRVVETPEAAADIDAIWLDGLTRFGPAQADRFQHQIYATLDRLAEFPDMGVSVSHIHHDARGLARPYPCKIIYRATDAELIVLRVYHGKQRKP